MLNKTNIIITGLACLLWVFFTCVPQAFCAWSADIEATPGGGSPCWYPALAGDNLGNWVLMFQDIRPGPVFYNTSYHKDIFFKKYNGAVWTSDQQISVADLYNGYAPAFACSNNYIYAVWSDEASRNYGEFTTCVDIYFSMSADWGSTWSLPYNVSVMGAGWDDTHGCNSPRITINKDGKGKICVVWEHPVHEYHDDRDVKAAISSNQGQTWSVNVLTAATVDNQLYEYPSVAADGTGKFFVICGEDHSTGWQLNQTGLDFFYFNGVSWTGPVELFNYNSSPTPGQRPSTIVWKPDIAVKDTNNIYVTFVADLDSSPAVQKHVYFMCRTNMHWSAPKRISQAGQESDVPRIIYDPFYNGVRVVYEENKRLGIWSGMTNKRLSDIVFASSADNGKTWAYTTLASGNYAGDPWIAENKTGVLGVAWEDNRTGDGDWRIYLKTGP